jgi:hypothetical protein
MTPVFDHCMHGPRLVRTASELRRGGGGRPTRLAIYIGQ